MKKTDGYIATVDENGTETLEVLMTYSEKEKQQNQINKANAARVFQPAFIPFFPALQREFKLTDTETKLYGFVWFYLSNASDKFYFTNEQMAYLLNCSPDTVSRTMSKLKEKGLISTRAKIRAGGGQVRYVRLGENYMSKLTKTTSWSRQKLQGNKNKINNNKIKRERVSTLSTPTSAIITNKSEINRKKKLIKSDLVEIAKQKQVPLSYVKETYEGVQDYEKSSGKTYKDYAATVRGWISRDLKEGKVKKVVGL